MSLATDKVFEKASEYYSKAAPFAMVTVTSLLGSAPRDVGTTMLVRENGEIVGTIGGGGIEATVIKEAQRSITEGKSRNFEIKSLSEVDNRCGGSMIFFINIFNPKPTLYLFGAGHVGQPTARMAKILGFRIVLIDERPQFANHERFPDADEIITDEIDVAIPKLEINNESYIVVVTHDHDKDERIVGMLANSPAAYIGMIGSDTKALVTLHNLKKKQIPVELLRRIRTPMGLEIGAETPEEIAVSIMGEIIKVRRGGTGEPMTVAHTLKA